MNSTNAILETVTKRKQRAARDATVAKQNKKRRGDDPGGLHALERDTATNNASERQLDSATEVERDNLPSTWKRATALEAPPPRPGFVQRWVRFRVNGNDDTENYDRYMEEGWRPRAPSSVKRGHLLTTTKNQANAQMIVKRGHVLMELTQRLADSRASQVSDALGRQTKAVENELFADNRGRAGAVMPLTDATFKSRASLAKRRPREPAADESDDN